MINKKSPLQIARQSYLPKLPNALKGHSCMQVGKPTESVGDHKEIRQLFPNTYGLPAIILQQAKAGDYVVHTENPIKVGVILSGGQAPGGHNVISGLFDGLKRMNEKNELYGFLGGPDGLVNHQYMLLTDQIIDEFRNTGGFDIIGSGRTKLDKPEQFDRGIEICKELGINAIVIVGGDDSNTNACILAEYYLQKGCGIQVIGIPKTIDGDLKNDQIETSFGFDTACKVYSELIGNIQRDANSAKKYWHFIRLMGRSASHIALECALQSQPNITLISEEIEAENKNLQDIVDYIVSIIIDRANHNENFGSILVPEGLIEFIPAMRTLIDELNELLANNEEFASMDGDDIRREYIKGMLTPESSELYRSLPRGIARQLTLDRDPHGNVMVSRIETEKLLIEMVSKRLAKMKAEGKYKGKFAALSHFFGYEGRCAIPSNFDADYCYSLGRTAVCLIAAGKTGYMATVKNLVDDASEWIPGGVPITMMMHMERRSGANKPVIQKAMVDLKGAPYLYFKEHREEWERGGTSYVYAGPIQYYGPTEVCNQPTRTLKLEHGSKV